MINRTLAIAALAFAAGSADAHPLAEEDKTMSMNARGTFEVEVEPAVQNQLDDGNSMGRFSLAKRYHGDLVGTAEGEMLTAGTAVEGSAAYVAIERVEGVLGGRRGTFLLQHRGTMSGAGQSLTITVVPDSGTGELVGLEGTLEITVADGEHAYALAYSLPGGR